MTLVTRRHVTTAAAAAALAAALLGAGPPGFTIEAPPPLIQISATSLTHEGAAPMTVVVSNPSPSTAGAVAVQASHPFATSVTSTADRGAYEPETGTWLVGDLDPGAAATLTLHP